MLVSGVETQLHCSQLKTAVNASCYSHAQCDDRAFIYSNTGNNTASSTCLDYLLSAAGALTLLCAVYTRTLIIYSGVLLKKISITDSVKSNIPVSHASKPICSYTYRPSLLNSVYTYTYSIAVYQYCNSMNLLIILRTYLYHTLVLSSLPMPPAP
jgi:hypothetical protein